MEICIIDIESNGLLSSSLDYSSLPYKLNNEAKLWCVVIVDVKTKEVYSKEKEEITKEWLEETLSKFDMIVAHNGVKFDFIMLKLFGLLDYKIGYLNDSDTCFGRNVRFLDTLILSRLSNPDRLGGHSLDAWGKRTGNLKTDYRKQCIENGYISKDSEKGEEFKAYNPLMLPYCIQDCMANIDTYSAILAEMREYEGDWSLAVKQEHKLADLAIRRETFGFSFDKELAVNCVEELTETMNNLTDKVNPELPKRKLNSGEERDYTPPKVQIRKDGQVSEAMTNFINRVGGKIEDGSFVFNNITYKLPLPLEPILDGVQATIKDMDTVKDTLIERGWKPTEWRVRNLMQDSKKQPIPYDKRVKALERWVKETFNGKYKTNRLEIIGLKNADKILEVYKKKLRDTKPVIVPTSPSVRVGVEKELCPNLLELGEKVSFAKDFADYLTYKHRKSSIAGGEIEDMDFDEETPNTGYLKFYREQDGRIPTPAIEIGSSTNRYTHSVVANIPRTTSIYGEKMRALFGAGKGGVQFAYDFASLEARVEGHFCYNGTNGIEYSDILVAEKPNDLHTKNATSLSISRTSAKNIKYGITYGSQVKKISEMLKCSLERATEIYDGFWENAPALKELKEDLEREWLQSGKKFIKTIDGRKINIRSKHSILNFLFQSTGVILAKYVNVITSDKLEKKGYKIDPFESKVDFTEMISYHDEVSYWAKPEFLKFKTFKSKEEAQEFVKNWKGSQLGAIQEIKKGVWFVMLPSVFSETILEAIKEVKTMFNLNVELGIELQCGRNWAECH